MSREKTVADAPSSDEVSTGRRNFARGLLAAGLSAAAGPLFAGRLEERKEDRVEVDYIVVGGGAGGGPVAARLAKAGFTVALLEAGIDAKGKEALSIDPLSSVFYDFPALLAAAAEYPQLSWDFFVNHYSDATQQARDSKFVPGKGILYSRGSTLGGSTAHNAMLFMYPHDADFDQIADATGDSSWRSANMRKYFQRLERCDYCQPNTPGHGYSGYINATMFDKQVFDIDPVIKDFADASYLPPSSYGEGNTLLDANHPRVAQGDTGSFVAPMHVAKNVRVSIRDYLVATQNENPNKLFLITGVLATKIITRGKKAIGVEYMRGANLYEADKKYNPSERPATQRIYAKREVIVSAGVFNTPQLLKLSGIGPAAELTSLGIDIVADLPGVGRNLQDRYEISVNVELNKTLELYGRCTGFQPADPCLTAFATGQWDGARGLFYGPYANNAIFATRIVKTGAAGDLPDLFLVGLAIPFRGFFPGFSQVAVGKSWTWLCLKAHTHNTAGTVKLKSLNPRQMPQINFHYFDEGNDRSGRDLEGVLHGVKLARSFVNDPRARQHVASESFPGIRYQSDVDLRQYIKNEAWGHHAACTAKIGADYDPYAVLDSRFRVRGVKRLRVVDASSFPRVPGFFPVAAVMMIGEKAADTILEDARRARVTAGGVEMED